MSPVLSAFAIVPPISEPSTPSASVQSRPIRWRPGRMSRARSPITSPAMRNPIMRLLSPSPAEIVPSCDEGRRMGAPIRCAQPLHGLGLPILRQEPFGVLAALRVVGREHEAPDGPLQAAGLDEGVRRLRAVGGDRGLARGGVVAEV